MEVSGGSSRLIGHDHDHDRDRGPVHGGLSLGSGLWSVVTAGPSPSASVPLTLARFDVNGVWQTRLRKEELAVGKSRLQRERQPPAE